MSYRTAVVQLRGCDVFGPYATGRGGKTQKTCGMDPRGTERPRVSLSDRGVVSLESKLLIVHGLVSCELRRLSSVYTKDPSLTVI